MSTVSISALQVAAFSTRSKAPSVASTTESSSPGLPVPSNGVESSHPGDALAAGLLLIFLFVVALATPLGRLTQPEPPGNKFSRSTNTDSLPKRSDGGTEKERYE